MPTLLAAGRHDLADHEWSVLEPLLPAGKKAGRPPKWARRRLIDGIRWRIRAGSPWRDVPPEYGPWQSVYGLFRRWQRDGTWKRLLTALQSLADAAGHVTWDVSVDSGTARAHQHAAGARKNGAAQQEPPGGNGAPEPADHALGRSRGGLTSKFHLACEQEQKPLAIIVTAGHRHDSPSSPWCWARSGFPGPAAAGPGPGRTASWRTRPTDQGRTAPGSAAAASAPPSPRRPTRSPAGRRRAAQGQAACLRQGQVQAAARRRVRNQPAQAQQGHRQPLRQARRPLRGHPPHRRDRRMAPAPHFLNTP